MKALHIIGLILKGILIAIWICLKIIGMLFVCIVAPEYVWFDNDKK